MRIRERLTEENCKGRGVGVQSVRAMVRAIIGQSRNRWGEAVVGLVGSLTNSFTPSAIGWRSP